MNACAASRMGSILLNFIEPVTSSTSTISMSMMLSVAAPLAGATRVSKPSMNIVSILSDADAVADRRVPKSSQWILSTMPAMSALLK